MSLSNSFAKEEDHLEEGRIIAELNFGFWGNLYERPYIETFKKDKFWISYKVLRNKWRRLIQTVKTSRA